MEIYSLKELKIEVTHQCPLACVHCSSDAYEKNFLSISKEKCLSILKEAHEVGVRDVAFSGGEPLCWEGLAEMIDYCSTNNIFTTIYTSGNQESIEEIMSSLSNCGLNRVVFSLYSHIEMEHIRITRKRDSYSNTIKAIKVAQQQGIETEIHFVAMRDNFSRLTEVVQLAEKKGVKRISVLRFVPQGRGVLWDEKGILTKEENKQLRDTILSLRKNGYDIRTGSPWNVLCINEKPECKAAQDRLVISPDLRIYPCDAFKQIKYETIAPEDSYATLENNSLIDCWSESQYLNIIRNNIQSPPSPPCNGCNNYSLCKSGCLAQKFIEYGVLNKNPDPICMRGVI